MRMSDRYAYCATLTTDQWAWEFLRRNPAYRADYRQFIIIWQALETDYGAPPNRDFQRWKQDPRAYGPLPGSSNSHLSDVFSGDACIGEDERVLLECWMGAKWGFHKFPLDPDRALPPTPDELSWRDLPAQPASDIDEKYRLDIAFDLSLPLPVQLDAARFRLVSRVSELRRSGHIAPRNVANQREHWTQLLQVLDRQTASAKVAVVEQEGARPVHHAHLFVTAQAMTQTGYREILRLAE